MKREPKIVRRADGLWDVTTSQQSLKGHYYLDHLGKWIGPWEGNTHTCFGVFDTALDGREALAKAGPPPADAVWDEDCEVAEPQPALAWKRIDETLEELRGMLSGATVDVLFANSRNIISWEVGQVLALFPHNDQIRSAHWTIIPRPKPAPTVAELERAVVEVACKWAVGGRLRPVADAADALLAHRERAKGGVK